MGWGYVGVIFNRILCKVYLPITFKNNGVIVLFFYEWVSEKNHNLCEMAYTFRIVKRIPYLSSNKHTPKTPKTKTNV